MELNGKQVEGKIEPAENIRTHERFLTVTFSDGTEAKVGDVLSHHTYGSRKIVQIAQGSGLPTYRLGYETED